MDTKSGDLGNDEGMYKRVISKLSPIFFCLARHCFDFLRAADSNMSCDDSRWICKEIGNLTSPLAKKELQCSQEVKKLRVMLSLKDKDMECLMKQNEELSSKNENLQNNESVKVL